MIVKTVRDNIFNTDVRHIVFGINKEGYNDVGFSGKISSKIWPELSDFGKHEIGDVFSKKVDDKVYHALVCHSLENGWGEDQAKVIQECFDKIPSDGEVIASVAIGTGLIGVVSGSDFRQIVCGMHDSNQEIILYTGYNLDEILNCYNEEKNIKKRVRKNQSR